MVEIYGTTKQKVNSKNLQRQNSKGDERPEERTTRPQNKPQPKNREQPNDQEKVQRQPGALHKQEQAKHRPTPGGSAATTEEKPTRRGTGERRETGPPTQAAISQLENSAQEPAQPANTQQARANRAPTIEEDNSSTQGSTQSLAWDNYDLQRRTQGRTRPQDTRNSQPTDEEEDGTTNRTGELGGTHSRREETDPPEEDDDDVFEQEELFSPARNDGNPIEEDEEDLFTPVRLWNQRSDQLSPERTETNISYNQLTEVTSESETENEAPTARLLASFNNTTPPNTTTTQQGPTHPTPTRHSRSTTPTTQTNRSKYHRRTNQRQTGQTSPQHNKTEWIEPTRRTNPGPTPGRALLPGDRPTTLILMMNLENRPVFVHKGMVLGHRTEIRTVGTEISEDDRPPAPRACMTTTEQTSKDLSVRFEHHATEDDSTDQEEPTTTSNTERNGNPKDPVADVPPTHDIAQTELETDGKSTTPETGQQTEETPRQQPDAQPDEQTRRYPLRIRRNRFALASTLLCGLLTTLTMKPEYTQATTSNGMAHHPTWRKMKWYMKNT
uniref:Uncharacterized protein n=1 Tax=Daphnia galeata TaxID=27404 RepID=A0A8J2RLS5_9CRUS|nr:unnamed protein product [Daphnia galeata]